MAGAVNSGKDGLYRMRHKILRAGSAGAVNDIVHRLVQRKGLVDIAGFHRQVATVQQFSKDSFRLFPASDKGNGFYAHLVHPVQTGQRPHNLRTDQAGCTGDQYCFAGKLPGKGEGFRDFFQIFL